MALGSLVQAGTGQTSLKKILQGNMASVETVAFLTAESWVRASSFPDLCPREEVLCSIRKVERKREISSDLALILEHGKALHHQLQNSILPSVGMLYGEWSCLRCGLRHGKKPEGPDRHAVTTWAIVRPERCSCGSSRFQYYETLFESLEYKIQGHPDGFLYIHGMPGLGILEAKSISQRGAWEVRNTANLSHVIQAHIYMWLSDLKWAKVVYWDKGSPGMSALLEHTIEREDDVLDRIKKTLSELWAGIKTGRLPDRICQRPDAPRACKCVVQAPCFERFEASS